MVVSTVVVDLNLTPDMAGMAGLTFVPESNSQDPPMNASNSPATASGSSSAR